MDIITISDPTILLFNIKLQYKNTIPITKH